MMAHNFPAHRSFQNFWGRTMLVDLAQSLVGDLDVEPALHRRRAEKGILATPTWQLAVLTKIYL